jgi:hypothetical protein
MNKVYTFKLKHLYEIVFESSHCLDETSVIHTLKNQLLSFTIDTSVTQRSAINDNAIIFNHIFTVFTNLQYLNFGQSSDCDERLSFYFTRPSVICTTLLELHVCVHKFFDCLYLLDGHFTQLRTLYVDVGMIVSMDREVNKTVGYFLISV